MNFSLKRAVPIEGGVEISIWPGVAGTAAATAAKAAKKFAAKFGSARILHYLCGANHHSSEKSLAGRARTMPDCTSVMPGMTECATHTSAVYQTAVPNNQSPSARIELEWCLATGGGGLSFYSRRMLNITQPMNFSLKRAVPIEGGVEISIWPGVAEYIRKGVAPLVKAFRRLQRQAVISAVCLTPGIWAFMLAGNVRLASILALCAALLVAISSSSNSSIK